MADVPDFTSKAQLPLAQIIQAIVNQPVAQQNMKMQQQENSRQWIATALNVGSTLAKGAVEASKMRQQREFANALANTKMTPGQEQVVGTGVEDQRIAPPGPMQEYSTYGATQGPAQTTTGLPPPTIGVASPVTQTQMTPPTDNPLSAAIRSGALVNPEATSKQFAENQFPTPTTMGMYGSGVPVYNAQTGERTFAQFGKDGTVVVAGQTMTPQQFHASGWDSREYAPSIMDNQFGVPTLYPKGGSQPTSFGAGVAGADNNKGIVGLQAQAPKLADRFVKSRDQAFPENNQALKTSVEAAASAAAVEAILKGPVNQVGLQSLGFHLARMSGSNSQLSDAERTTFERGYSLLRRVKDQGYKLGAGDLSPEMRKDLTGLAAVLRKRASAQGQRYILSAKRNAAGQVGPRLYKSLELDKEFPSVDDLVAQSSEMTDNTDDMNQFLK